MAGSSFMPFFSVLILSTLLNLVLGQSEEVCFSPGECLLSPYIDSTIQGTPRECSEHCDSLNDDEDKCNYFTHYAGTGECLSFLVCEEFNADTCDDCISGPRHCEDYPLCNLPGKCVDGDEIDALQTETADECLASCKLDSTDCFWYSFDNDIQECSHYTTCPTVSTDNCPDCIYGQKECITENGPGSKEKYLMVVGGEGYYASDYPWIINLRTSDGNPRDCTADINQNFGPSRKDGIQEHVLMLDGQGTPVACGGLLGWDEEDLESVGNQCYSPGPSESSNYLDWLLTPFTMIQARTAASVVKLEDGRYWIIGGSEESGETELFQDGVFESGPVLPVNLDRSCAVAIGNNRVMIAGGYSLEDGSDLSSMWIYDWSSSEWISDLLAMPRARHGHGCGVRLEQGNKQLVIVGGVGTEMDMSIYDIETDTWTSGDSNYPMGELRYPTSMPYLDTFLVIGGRNTEGDYYYDEIHRLEENGEWVYVEEISDETSQAGAVYVDESKVIEYGCEYLLNE